MSSVSLFHELSTATIHRLRRQGTERSFRAGEVVCDPDAAAGVLAITSGQVKIWRGLESGAAITLGLLTTGEAVGLTTVVAGLPRRSMATALSRVSALTWYGPVFLAEMRLDAQLCTNVSEMMAHHLRAAADRMEELADMSVERRLARALVRIERQAREEAGTSGPRSMRISQGDLAELARTTVPTVSRLVTRWRREGLVATARGWIEVLDPARLLEGGRGPG